MTQEQRDAIRAKSMAELSGLIPNTLRCVEVLKQHCHTLSYIESFAEVEDLLSKIAVAEEIPFDLIMSVYKHDFWRSHFAHFYNSPETK